MEDSTTRENPLCTYIENVRLSLFKIFQRYKFGFLLHTLFFANIVLQTPLEVF